MGVDTCARCGNQCAIYDIAVPMRGFRVCHTCLGAIVWFIECSGRAPKRNDTLYCEDCGKRLPPDTEHNVSHTLRRITEVASP